MPDTHRSQAEYEVSVICQKGYPGYFLVTADLVRYAKDNGIRVGPGRGSAARCLVAYAMGITDLDPIRHKLIFERFLNPERPSAPDIGLPGAGHGDSAAAIKTLWDILLPFSDYAFNRAHTAGYGLVSYWTAYLKANRRSSSR